MSEQQSLILNLNDIIKEYIRNEEEVTLELQIMVIQEERKEIEQSVEESRKMKRNKENIEIEEKEEENEEDELISNEAYMVMKDTLKEKCFIGKRGFDKLISPFREVIEKRRWNLFCKHKPAGFVALL